jgi:hypothetical protein
VNFNQRKYLSGTDENVAALMRAADRWQGNGFCQVWDESIPTTPWPSDYTTVSESVPTFVEALALKEGLIRAGTCTF